MLQFKIDFMYAGVSLTYVRAMLTRAVCLLVLLVGLTLAFPLPVDDEALSSPMPGPGNTLLTGVRQDRLGQGNQRPARWSTPASVPWVTVQSELRRQHGLVDQRIRAENAAREVAQHSRVIALLHEDLSLHGVGTQLYTAWNTPMTLKSVNWYGFEFPPFVPGGLDHATLDSILDTVRRLGFNSLRIMFANATVQWNPIVTDGLDANPELRGLRSLDIMQRIVERAKVHGLRVILCNSRSEPGMGPELRSGLWYTDQFSDATWRKHWIMLVKRLRNNTAFVGADLRNEPHIIGTHFDLKAYFTHGPLWGAYQGTYYYDRDWRYAAETLGNTMLQINPRLLIIVEGVQMYLDPFRNKLTGALWGGNLIGVQYDPIMLSRQSQLVYSIHEYGPKMYLASWFNHQTTYDSLARRWTNLWGYLLTAPKFMQAPLYVGEFGTCDDYWSCVNSNDTTPWSQGYWFKSFVRYMVAHPQVGWAYWALNPVGPFRPQDRNFYSVMTYDWHHFYPWLLRGLAPLLQEPDG